MPEKEHDRPRNKINHYQVPKLEGRTRKLDQKKQINAGKQKPRN